jgi:hypothetical protein
MPFRTTAEWLAVTLFVTLGNPCSVTSAQATNVDVQLVLAADSSGSIDDGEHALQRMGYAQALRDPRVLNAIRGGSEQAIAVTYVEWTGRGLQMEVVPWTVIKDADSAERVAQLLLSMPRGLYGGGTAVGEAIFYSASLFEHSGFEGERKVIDVSGDGPTNQGRSAASGRDFANELGITVNGLPILTDYPGLDVFYEQNVIGGPGAFMVPANGFHDFSDAVLHKLIREVAGTPPRRDLAENKSNPNNE